MSVPVVDTHDTTLRGLIHLSINKASNSYVPVFDDMEWSIGVRPMLAVHLSVSML